MPGAGTTRERLQRCAMTLFTEHGFDGTTVADIARAAGVSHMTFFRHFPTKESVLLDDPYDPAIGAAVAAQPAHLTPLERVRRGLLAAWSALPEPADDQTRARVAIVAAHAGLRARAWENNQRTEHVVVAALVDDGVPPLAARVAAGACLGALMAALLDWAEDDVGPGLGARVRAALDQLAVDRTDVAPAGSEVAP
ncbi:TetR family transcriptional regulator [Cellulomonas sp. ATA003]|uniref:TetR family transcriptional regulator n=1 Tax=Cellulomonas sp. ATA003 TaxID=3073064 RepID=UPI002873D9FF|nr:TetR family transcriptional regulator [Cellulomonas sp. ATA003]WNB87267.1 TetR family transcriptional regulator [Cellulomonas sp. ATA003]